MTDVLMITHRTPTSSHPKPNPKEMVFGTKLISVQHLRSEDHTKERDGSKTGWKQHGMCSLHCWAGNMARSLGHMQANAESAENDKATSTPFSILG